MSKKVRILVVLLTALFSCREPFDSKSISGASDYLVVEGIINASGPTNIVLSRTLKLTDKINVKNELKAQVQVEGESGGVFPLTEKGSGIYSVTQLNLNTSQRYRLRIKTSGGKEYLSDYVPVLVTPSIDNVNWTRDDTGVKISVNAHDLKTQSRYYRWEYEETWEMHSREIGSLEFLIPTLSFRFRTPKELEAMAVCWKTQSSTSIIIGSTAKLDDNIVHEQPMLTIPDKTEKLDVKYSILVRQYAITREAYEYLSMMKKNSEQTGSFFDLQPSELRSNIRSTTNPNEPVIGFVQISSAPEKRLFITRADVPGWDYLMDCSYIYVSAKAQQNMIEAFGHGNYDPLYEDQERWLAVEKKCTDCRVRGGNNTKPSFW